MTRPQDRESLPTCVNGLNPLPEAYWEAIRAGLPAIRAGLPAISGGSGSGSDSDSESDSGDNPAVSEAQLQAIGDHVRLLVAWNGAINLSGIRAPEMIARDHVLDSLTALPLLRRAGVEEFLDIGSGGGFPGLPLAVALPARRALLVESVGKKARFLATAVEATGLGDCVAVAATRAETLAADPRHRGHWQAVVARAVADMTELAELALPLLQIGGLLVAWKGQPVNDELARADSAIHQLRGRLIRLQPVVVPGLEDHVLVVVEKLAETPREFPRDPAARRRRPL
ncbi:MAG TPA: 16S rRNA (guanine(527)-N(7))-methyltransferase RsmG [Candidatus Limnocylindrales bacterium]